jgi:glyoxylase-like metal-dependent hydrolase (beta-lactamase superfamily II)
MAPHVEAFFDDATNTVSYVVSDPNGRAAAIIDSVLDFDYASGRTDTASADAIVAHVRREGLEVEWILETHVHADHLSAAPYLQERLGGRIGIGENITRRAGHLRQGLQRRHRVPARRVAVRPAVPRGRQLPHRPASRRRAPHAGPHARLPDLCHRRRGLRGRHALHAGLRDGALRLPGGSAETMYDSVQKILALPDETRIFVGHDYKAPGRDEYAWETTVGEQKAKNVHVGGGRTKADFVKMRTSGTRRSGCRSSSSRRFR